MNPPARADGREHDELRPVTIERGFVRHALGSALYSAGNTRVICTASLVAGLPPWLEGKATGWATGEYSMLPAATSARRFREGRGGLPPGRSVEIQRLIGRSIRAALDLAAFPGLTLHVDCDVVDADGSTRCAAITGSYVALRDAVANGLARGALPADPIREQVAAVSVGLVGGVPFLDLSQEEDSAATFDLNVVVSGSGRLIEVQGTAEGEPLSRERFLHMLDLASAGAERLFRIQRDLFPAA